MTTTWSIPERFDTGITAAVFLRGDDLKSFHDLSNFLIVGFHLRMVKGTRWAF